MSATPGPSASELAAAQVEQIVSAAQLAAEEIRREAQVEQEELRRWAQADSEELRKEAHRKAEATLAEARNQAVALATDARREADALLENAREDAARTREQTQRAVNGRLASAEKAAADVLEEARALSGGLHQLGKSLGDHAERILRDVTAAHKRMQANLRVGDTRAAEPAATISADPDPAAARRSAPAGKAPTERPGEEARLADHGSAPGGRSRRNPLEDLEVPTWVGHSRSGSV